MKNKISSINCIFWGLAVYTSFLIISLFLTVLNVPAHINRVWESVKFILKGIYYLSITVATLKMTALLKRNQLLSLATANIFHGLSIITLLVSISIFTVSMISDYKVDAFVNLRAFQVISFLFLRLPPQLIFFFVFYLIQKSIKISLEIKTEHDLTI